jgi:hypothetical protein
MCKVTGASALSVSDTPIELATSAKKAGDAFARLLAARIGAERASLAFASTEDRSGSVGTFPGSALRIFYRFPFPARGGSHIVGIAAPDCQL